jgi:toxin ParE1/3/4
LSRRIVFSPEAQRDLLELYDYIAVRDGDVHAIRYIGRIEKWCKSLDSFPERGMRRDDIRPGLRVMGFERRVTIAFRVGPAAVTILRILYGGRDVLRALRRAD